MGKIRVLFVDDHELAREGLKFFLSGFPSVEVVGCAATPSEALHLITCVPPDIVTVDLGLPSIEMGLGLVKDIKLRHPRIKVLTLTAYDGPVTVRGALSAGVDGYVLKSIHFDELYSAIVSVAGGNMYITPSIMQYVIGWCRNNSPGSNAPIDNLSRREREVLCLVAKGKQNKEIGEALFISHRTVEKHKLSLKQKLDCRNSVELATYYLQYYSEK